MDYLVIDRLEQAFAVCETADGKRVHLERVLLPPGAKEGSVMRFVNGAYQLDEEKEERLRRSNWELQKRVFGSE